jgi:hypothetical protein
VIVYETFTYWRQIFVDGRTVDPDANPTWMGYSTGRWEGDTFVVDTRGFNGKRGSISSAGPAPIASM